VVDSDPRFASIQELSDVSEFTLKEIHNFFENYKTLQNIDVVVGDYHSKAEAIQLLKECRDNYREE
jgi:inorganic pyrophosphatase